MELAHKSGRHRPHAESSTRHHPVLLDNPEWTQMCLGNKCSFVQHGDMYVCERHFSAHTCSPSVCRQTALMAHKDVGPEGCPFVALLTFKKPQVEYRVSGFPHANPGTEPGYSHPEHMCSRGWTKHVSPVDGVIELREKLLRASVPVLVALYATLVTRAFKARYGENSSNGASAKSRSWMVVVSRRAKAMMGSGRTKRPTKPAHRTAVREATLNMLLGFTYILQSETAPRFVSDLMARYNASRVQQKLWIQLVTMIVMLALCLHSHIEHGPVYRIFSQKTLAILFFDKDLAPHKCWSKLSKLISHDSKRITAHFPRSAPKNGLTLPAVVTATLEDMLSEPPERVAVQEHC